MITKLVSVCMGTARLQDIKIQKMETITVVNAWVPKTGLVNVWIVMMVGVYLHTYYCIVPYLLFHKGYCVTVSNMRRLFFLPGPGCNRRWVKIFLSSRFPISFTPHKLIKITCELMSMTAIRSLQLYLDTVLVALHIFRMNTCHQIKVEGVVNCHVHYNITYMNVGLVDTALHSSRQMTGLGALCI